MAVAPSALALLLPLPLLALPGCPFPSSQGDELHPAAAPAAATPVNLHLPRCGVFCWARCGQPRGWAQAVAVGAEVAGSVGMLVLWHSEVCAGQTPSCAAVSAAVSDH